MGAETPTGPERGDLDGIAELIGDSGKFLLTTHEGPDGDALGSMLGMHELLRYLGKDSVMFLAAKEFPLPSEYRHIPLENVFHEAPADLDDRIVVFLDCGNAERMPVDFLLEGGRLVVNIDHHHDNTDFGDLFFVDPGASSTAEIVFRLAKALDVSVDPVIAAALYIGIVTDTGKFMYDSTSAETHEVAADLLRAGVDVDDVNRRVYESLPVEKLSLLGRALQKMRIDCGGRLITTYIEAEDYEDTGSGEEMTEGIVDHLRSVEGVEVAAVVRDQLSSEGAVRRISLRAAEPGIDVSRIARQFGGGGHVKAAGCSSELGYEEILGRLCDELDSEGQ